MAKRSQQGGQTAWDEIIELDDLPSAGDHSSLLDSPRSQSSLNIRKLKPNNRIRSPPYSHHSPSTNESSNTLSPITKNAFFAKQPVPVPRKKVLQPLKTPRDTLSALSDTSEGSRNIITLEHLEHTASSPSGNETQSVFSGKSNQLSYREKMRERFLSVKQQAGNTVLKMQSPIERKPMVKLPKVKKDIVIDMENQEIEDKIQKHSQKKSDWDETIRNKLLQKIRAADFFTKDDFEENIESDFEDSKKVEAKKEDEIFESPLLENKHQIIDISYLTENLIEHEVCIFKKPEVFKASKSDLVYLSGKPISLADKLGQNSEPRYLEDEGFYIANDPGLSNKELNFLEERLLLSENRNWFGCDGHLKFVSNPRRQYITKNPSDESLSVIQTKFTPGIVQDKFLLQNSLLEKNRKTIKIHLQKLQFNYHPLFSPEHILAKKLEQNFENYQKLEIIKPHERAFMKLKSLRQAVEKLEVALQNNEDPEIYEKQKRRYHKYLKEIKETRSLFLDEYKSYRDVIKSLLKIWKALKSAREYQKFSNTSIRLIIKKQKSNYHQDKDELENLITTECSEIAKEEQLKYSEKLAEYYVQIKSWKQQREKTEEKPKKPHLSLNIDEIKEEVIKKYTTCLKPAGEPKLGFEILYDHPISVSTEYPREQSRRIMLSKEKLTVKIFFDKHEVCQVGPVGINENFTCHLNQIISIELFTVPLEITLEIDESGTNSHWNFEEILLNVPEATYKYETSTTQTMFFKMESNITFSHTGVGNGKNFKNIFSSYSLNYTDDLEETYSLNGNLMLQLGWDIQSLEENLVEPSDSKKNTPLENQLDPLDPQNTLILSYLRRQSSNQPENSSHFKINLAIGDFCTDEQINENLRFKLLKLRSEGEFEFQDKVIPNNEHEIPSEIYNDYEIKKMQSRKLSLDEDSGTSPIDIQRQWGLKRFTQIKNRIAEMCRSAENTYTLKDILVDDEIPDIGSLGLTFMSWFQPKRPLRPMRKNTITNQAILPSSITHDTEVKIIINVVQAFQVPVKRNLNQDMTLSPSKKSISSDIVNVCPVRPCVTASIGKSSARTTTAEGSNPTWNQELVLAFHHRGNGDLKGNIHFQLFDERLVDLLEDDRLRESDIHQRRQLQWLASLEIPLASLTQTGRMEGTFEMYSPSLIIGYERIVNTDDNMLRSKSSHQRESTYLSLFITLMPLLSGVQIFKDDKLECNEISYLQEHVKNWQFEYNQMFPTRTFPCFVKDVSGKTCCITRFVRPLDLPDFGLNEKLSEEELCARFVSLIPFADLDPKDVSDIWLTSDQLLKLQIGSIADHTVLLQCYFMTLEKESWIVYGQAVPYGNSTFVLVKEKDSKENNSYFIYDVFNAHKYNILESFCPLKRIFCLINQDNIWANIQKDDRSSMTRFDLAKTSDWMCLFNKQTAAPTGSLQPPNLDYTERIDTNSLQGYIENKLRTSIMKWRRQIRTTWNRHACSVFKKLLPHLEQHTISEKQSVLDLNNWTHGVMLDIQQLINSYIVFGFPICLPYTTTRNIIDKVKRTGVHLNDAPNLEFALAVYLHSYQNGIIAVWIFISTLVKRR